MEPDLSNLQYSILDPTGNITALVESPVDPAAQPSAAAAIMVRHPEVEQVGFVRFSELKQPEAYPQVNLRMAGGEFCGNAAMCAAVLYQIHRRSGESGKVTLQVSGTSQPVPVWLQAEETDCFSAEIRMPATKDIKMSDFSFCGKYANLPVVRMDGITHIVIREDSPLFFLKKDRHFAEEAVKIWCRQMSSGSLGLIFLEKGSSGMRLTPLVYVPGSGTLFWENSCASGTAAVGIITAKESGKIILELEEPGGILKVSSDPSSGETLLSGKVRLIQDLI